MQLKMNKSSLTFEKYRIFLRKQKKLEHERDQSRLGMVAHMWSLFVTRFDILGVCTCKGSCTIISALLTFGAPTNKVSRHKGNGIKERPSFLDNGKAI